MKYIIIILTTVTVFFSCKKEKSVNNNSEYIWGIHSKEEAYDLLGDYAHFAFPEASGLTIRNYSHPIQSRTVFSAYYRDDAYSDLKDGGTYFIGSNSFNFDATDNLYHLNSDENDLYENISGSNHDFKLLQDGEELFKKNIYIPEALIVTPEQELHEQTGTYLIDGHSNLPINWEPDSENTNGILVILNWTGDIYGIHPNDTEYQSIERAVLAKDDDGSFTIEETLFNGIPKNGIFQLTFFRGSFSKEYAPDGSAFQVYAFSQTSKDYIIQ